MGVFGQLIRRLTWRLALFWLILLGALWLFVEFADEVYEGNGLPFDEPILRWFETLQEPWLTQVMYALSVFGDVPSTLALAALTLVALTIWLRSERLFFLVALGGASMIMLATKYILARPRPELFPEGAELYTTSTPSFPSGHATGSAAFYLTLYLLARHTIPKWSWLVGLVGAVLALSITASRLYLQVHYPSDVLAGLALGSGWVLGGWALFHRDRSYRWRLIRLPRSLAGRLRDRAVREERDEDEVIADALRDALEANREPESARRS